MMRKGIVLLLLFFFWGVSGYAEFDGDPVYENTVSATNGSFYAVRPFYSFSQEAGGERWRKDYFWPLYTRKGFKEETYGRFLFFGYSLEFSADSDRYRNWILPFYFRGIDKQGESYMAIFPFGGSIHEFAGRDKVNFVMFPLYMTSSINEVHTKDILFPIYSKTEGGKVSRFRVWPFYGRASLEGEFNKGFVMWPFYLSVEYLHERNKGKGFILFPFYGQVKNKQAETYWVLPPFFRYLESEKQRIISAPWPFIQIADGEMYKRVFWPIAGKKKLGTLTRSYLCWPILWNNKTSYARHEQRRRMAVPFLWYESEVVTKKMKSYEVGDVPARYWKIWPLMSWERKEGYSRFRTIELWPMRDTPGIERNWAPYWTLYRRMAENGAVSHHVLWGIYRQSKSEEHFEWSLIKGLLGYKKTKNDLSYKFLFMTFGNKGK